MVTQVWFAEDKVSQLYRVLSEAFQLISRSDYFYLAFCSLLSALNIPTFFTSIYQVSWRAMRATWVTLVLLYLLAFSAQDSIEESRAAVKVALCDPTYPSGDTPLPPEYITDPNDPRLKALNIKPE